MPKHCFKCPQPREHAAESRLWSFNVCTLKKSPRKCVWCVYEADRAHREAMVFCDITPDYIWERLGLRFKVRALNLASSCSLQASSFYSGKRRIFCSVQQKEQREPPHLNNAGPIVSETAVLLLLWPSTYLRKLDQWETFGVPSLPPVRICFWGLNWKRSRQSYDQER